MPSLLLGAGNDRRKKVFATGEPDWTGELITLDMNPDCGATVVWNLEDRPLPFPDDYFDDIGAYDVLEHIGKQGDWKGWFDEMGEYHRILKPGGSFGIIVPVGKDAFADPGHTRFFAPTWFGFLRQKFYDENLENGAPVTDYRWYWKKNFEIAFYQECGDHHLALRLVKA